MGDIIMALSEYLSLKESADLLGYAVETLRILLENGFGPPRSRRIGTRPYRRCDVLRYRKKLTLSPNDLMQQDTPPIFARHDDGRWWPRLTYDEAVTVGASRYFDGTACELCHRCECYTKTRQCTECAEIKSGRGAKRYLLNQVQNSSASPGCNLP